MSTRWFIGLTSGSSADGVDACLLETEGVGLGMHVQPRNALHQPFPGDLRQILLRAGGSAPFEVKQLSLLHRLLGESFASAARSVADQASFPLHQVQCIGFNGHTVWHEPEGRFPSTLNLGMASIIAERTGVTVAGAFRERDLAAGGQGAPLSALVDYLLFQSEQEPRLLLHLGGLTRLVYIPAGAEPHQIIGFEVGPCTVLLNALIRQMTHGREAFDPGGRHAVQGRCLDELLARWLTHPYVQRRPPKSLPRNQFGDEFAAQIVQQAKNKEWVLHDVLCTAAHFVARSVADAVQRFLPAVPKSTRVYLSGGGVRNGLLWHLLEQQLHGLDLERIDALGVGAGMRKPLALGVLTALTMDGVPGNVPTATGAAGTRLLGQLTPGSLPNWSRCVLWMAEHALLPVEQE